MYPVNEPLRKRIETQLLAAIKAAKVWQEPFCHLRMTNVFDTSLYRELVENLPGDDMYSEFFHPDAVGPDGRSTRFSFVLQDDRFAKLDRVRGEFWSTFSAAVLSDLVRISLYAELSRDLTKRFQCPPEELVSLESYPTAALLRDHGGYRIKPHPDTEKKIVTFHLYLPADSKQLESGTEFYTRTSVHRLIPWRRRDKFDILKKFEFVPNTGFAFAVGADSWHGVRSLPYDTVARDSLSVLYFREPGHSYA